MTRRHFTASSIASLALLAQPSISLFGQDKDKLQNDDEKIDIEQIKKETREALPEEDQSGADLTHITEEFVKKAMAGATDPDSTEEKPKSHNYNGLEFGSPYDDVKKKYKCTDYGNHYFKKNGTVYFKYGEAGSKESYSCGQKYTRRIKGATVSEHEKCDNGDVIYKFTY
jgi:hypothetical protein